MSAPWSQERIAGFLFDELSPSDRARFESELERDSGLRDEVRALRETVSTLREAMTEREPLALAPETREAILRVASRGVPRSSSRAGLALTFRWIPLATSIALLLSVFQGNVVIKKFRESKRLAVRIQLASYQQALQAYVLAKGRYPDTAQGLQALLPDYFGKRELVSDPWGNAFRYRCDDGKHYELSSDGPDHEPGTSDDIRAE